MRRLIYDMYYNNEISIDIAIKLLDRLELKRKLNEIQKITDSNIEKIDKIFELKKADILKV